MKSNKQAFTLIELLVVVLIIGILAAVAMPQYQKAVDKSRAVTVISTVKELKEAQEIYFLANGQYATDFDELDVQLPRGELTTNTNRYRFYKNGERYMLYIKNGITRSVKASPKGFDGSLWFELYLDSAETDDITCDEECEEFFICGGENERSRNVCKVFGGTTFVDGNENAFRLPF